LSSRTKHSVVSEFETTLGHRDETRALLFSECSETKDDVHHL